MPKCIKYEIIIIQANQYTSTNSWGCNSFVLFLILRTARAHPIQMGSNYRAVCLSVLVVTFRLYQQQSFCLRAILDVALIVVVLAFHQFLNYCICIVLSPSNHNNKEKNITPCVLQCSEQ